MRGHTALQTSSAPSPSAYTYGRFEENHIAQKAHRTIEANMPIKFATCTQAMRRAHRTESSTGSGSLQRKQ
eukprot:654631-Prymnesium_polylepis.1